MIAFTQPFSITGAGGGARILRSLLEEAPIPYISIAASPFERETSTANEINIPRRPYLGHTVEHLFHRASGLIGNVLEYGTLAWQSRYESQVREAFRSHGVTAVHAIPQGIEFWYTYRVAQQLSLPYILTVHDDLSYNLRNFPYEKRALGYLGEVWRGADIRFVISEEMGHEYNRRYGKRPFTIVTDGVRELPSQPRPCPRDSLRIYFMGAVHTAYEKNFVSLVHALSLLKVHAPSFDIQFTIRGGLPFALPETEIPVTVLGWGTQEDVELDMKQADVLYLPLPLESRFDSFTKYSLSTKMVTYLGSGIPILYHGPEQSAAGRILSKHHAAFMAHTTDTEKLVHALSSMSEERDRVVRNALSLTDSRFRIEQQRNRFWNPVLDLHKSRIAA